MHVNELSAISPVDGRYRSKTESLSPFFSEIGLIRYRLKVEIEYLIALNEEGLKGFEQKFTAEDIHSLRSLVERFSRSDANRIKEIEKRTNHDVKALEYYIKEELDKSNLKEAKEWVHFGLTSQDINNTAVPLSIKDALETVLIPDLQKILSALESKANEYQQIAMLARTHGQAASPTMAPKWRRSTRTRWAQIHSL